MEPWFDEKEIDAMNSYIHSGGWYTEFKKTEELEKMIADYTGAKYCVMTMNGTVSLILAIMALDIEKGSEILVPDLTMIASPNSAKLLGINPVLVDVEEKTLCMDLNKAKKSLTSKTKAIMYVSLNGRSPNMNDVKKFCQKNNLYLIEDAAQSLGSYWNGKHLGTFGEIGTLSFAVPKIITMGQGGALLTDNPKLYKKIKTLKDFGRSRGGIDIHDEWGWNFKITDLQAVVGIEQMKKLAFRVKRKKEIYKRYMDPLKKIEEITILNTDLSETTPWAIDIYVNNPSKLASYLKSKGIGSRFFYPPIHTQKIYKASYDKNAFPVANKYGTSGLWLPSSTKLTNEEVDYVTNAIENYFR